MDQGNNATSMISPCPFLRFQLFTKEIANRCPSFSLRLLNWVHIQPQTLDLGMQQVHIFIWTSKKMSDILSQHFTYRCQWFLWSLFILTCKKKRYVVQVVSPRISRQLCPGLDPEKEEYT